MTTPQVEHLRLTTARIEAMRERAASARRLAERLAYARRVVGLAEILQADACADAALVATAAKLIDHALTGCRAAHVAATDADARAKRAWAAECGGLLKVIDAFPARTARA